MTVAENNGYPVIANRHADESTPLLPSSEDFQIHVLPRKRLFIVMPALALVQFTSFLDQTAIATSLPAIASALNTGSSITWVATSFVTASTSIQLVSGRLSDIFGRKSSLATALIIMGLANLLSGFSTTPNQLYATRALAGLGAGAINALIQIAITDIAPLSTRGFWFGTVGITVALGNGLGPLIGGALTERTSWRWAFWFVCPLVFLAVGWHGLVYPSSKIPGKTWEKIKRTDWLGIFLNLISIVLVLIPLSQGGLPNAWQSPLNIVMLISGLVLFITFIILEFWYIRLPILPIRVFQYGRSTNTLLAINILIGWLLWGNLFYVPLYLQVVRGWSPAIAGAYMLPLVIAHALVSAGSGVFMAYRGTYTSIIRVGMGVWLVGAVMKCTYNHNTSSAFIVITGIFEGVGAGSAMQPVLVGLLAGSKQVDRSGISSLRNFIRDTGSAIGLTVSGVIMNNALQDGLKGHFSIDFISELISSALMVLKSDISPEKKTLISHVYMLGLHKVFVCNACLVFILLISGFSLHEYGCKGMEETKPSSPSTEGSVRD